MARGDDAAAAGPSAAAGDGGKPADSERKPRHKGKVRSFGGWCGEGEACE
jgi:hypothetical protein